MALQRHTFNATERANDALEQLVARFADDKTAMLNVAVVFTAMMLLNYADPKGQITVIDPATGNPVILCPLF